MLIDMMGAVFLSIICMTFSSGPNRLGSACSGVAGGEDVMSCIEAPACLVRLSGNEYAMYMYSGTEGVTAITAMLSRKMESLDFFGGVEWAGSDTTPDTLNVIFSVARTLRGDPIGFMQGVFGPSISIGAGLNYAVFTPESEEDSAYELAALAGMQFSVFPTIALGAQISEMTLYSSNNSEWNPLFEYGVTCIFDRNLKVHFTVSDTTGSLGADLSVTPQLTIRSGSDGSGWNFGAAMNVGKFTINYGVLLAEETYTHSIGLIFKSGESL